MKIRANKKTVTQAIESVTRKRYAQGGALAALAFLEHLRRDVWKNTPHILGFLDAQIHTYQEEINRK